MVLALVLTTWLEALPINGAQAHTGIRCGARYAVVMSEQIPAAGPGPSADPPIGQPSTADQPPTQSATTQALDLETATKRQEFENLRITHTKTQAEIDNLNKSEWRKPTTWFSAFTAVGVVVGVIAGLLLSRVAYEKAQVAADRAELRAERAERDAANAETQRKTAEAEFQSVTAKLTSERGDLDRAQAQATALKGEIADLQSRAEKAALTLFDYRAVPPAWELERFNKFLQNLQIALLVVRNDTPDKIMFYTVGTRTDEASLSTLTKTNERMAAALKGGAGTDGYTRPGDTVVLPVSSNFAPSLLIHPFNPNPGPGYTSSVLIPNPRGVMWMSYGPGGLKTVTPPK
jgi:hypothetical protein